MSSEGRAETRQVAGRVDLVTVFGQRGTLESCGERSVSS